MDSCDTVELNINNTGMILVQTQICTTELEALCEFTFRR